MNDLTEFDHAVSAAFGEQLSDRVQNAWLDSTAYWTVWLGQIYGTVEAVIDYDGSIGRVFDARGKCEQAGFYCPPTWQLFRSCETDTAFLMAYRWASWRLKYGATGRMFTDQNRWCCPWTYEDVCTTIT